MYFLLFGTMIGFVIAIIGYQKNLKTTKAFLSETSSKRKNSVVAIIAAKNEEEVIEETVFTLLEKAPNSFRLIVVDDGSTDSTPVILEKLKSKFSNLLVLKNNGLAGKPDSLNTALKVVNEDLVLFIDADARVDWNFVSQHTRSFSKNDVDVVFADFQPYNRKRTSTVIFQDIFFAMVKIFIFSGLFSKPAFMNSGVFIKRELLEKAGKFDSETIVDDFNLILKLWKENKKIKYVLGYPCLIQYASGFKDLLKQFSRWQTGIIKELFKNLKSRKKTALSILVAGGLIIYSPFIFFFVGLIPGMSLLRTAALPFELGAIYSAGLFAYICQERRKTDEILFNATLGMPIVIISYQLTMLLSFFRAFRKKQNWYKVKRERPKEANNI